MDIEEDVARSDIATATASDNDNDAEMFSIVKIHASEEYHTLAEKEYYLLAVRTKHTERHNSESTIYNW